MCDEVARPPGRQARAKEEAQERVQLCAEFDRMRDAAACQEGDLPTYPTLGGENFKDWCGAELRAIHEGAALAYHCDAFARRAEEQCQGDGPGPGGDWMDICGAPSKAARDAAEVLLERIGAEQVLRGWYVNTRVEHGHRKEPRATDFGHYLAMQAMGHGVAWSDEHPDPGFEVPHLSGIDYDIDQP